jgi:hypothetical protein
VTDCCYYRSIEEAKMFSEKLSGQFLDLIMMSH